MASKVQSPDTGLSPPDEEEERQVRLSVNLNATVAETLKSYSKRQGITVTEAIRRAVGVLKYIDDAQRRGATLNIEESGSLKEVQFLV